MYRNSIFIFALLIAAFYISCNKQSSNSGKNGAINSGYPSNSASQVSDADVTQVLTQAVSGSVSGMATQTETTARLASACSLACGTTSDTIISGASPSWAIISYNYNLNFSRTCTCTNGIPSQYNTTIVGSSGYNIIIMSSTDSTNAQISVSGVQSSSPAYTLNENYVRKGSQQSSISAQHSFNSLLTITSDNIIINKSTMQITSGNANAQFAGTSAGGSAVNHMATITFLGNNQAILVIDNGNPQSISW